MNIIFATSAFANDLDKALELTISGNYDEALKIITLAVENNEPRGYGAIGLYKLLGLGMKQDCSQAYKYFAQAAEGGHEPSMNLLSVLSLPSDLDVSFELFSDSKNADLSINAISKCRIKNVEKALIYTSKLAELQNAEGLNNLGAMYEHGIYVEKDLEKSIEYFQLSSDKGYSLATLNLIEVYSEQNKSEIKSLSKKLILKNEYRDRAFYHLGAYYINNETEKDISLGMVFISIAYYLGDELLQTHILENTNISEDFDAKFSEVQLELSNCINDKFELCDDIINKIKSIN